MMFRLVAVICCLATVGCVAPKWPTKNPPPYHSGEYQRIFIGASTREDVSSILGQPQLKLEGGNLWIYGRSGATATDGLGGYFHEYKVISIKFDEDTAKSKAMVNDEHMNLLGACWGPDKSLCIEPEWDFGAGGKEEPRVLSRRYSAVTSLREDDVQAKRFTPDDGHCLVYVYSGRNFFRSTIPPVLSIGTARDEPVPSSGYLRIQSPPQSLQLVAGDNTADIECRAGTLHFYKLDRYMGAEDGNIHIKHIEADEGRKAVKERRLLLTW